jgi:phosphoglucosamine mutase
MIFQGNHYEAPHNMTLIKSISGIRGTIGGSLMDGFNPLTIVHFVVGYAQHIKLYESIDRPTIVVGRDARLSGEMVQQVVIGTLLGMGCDVIRIGLATTPTTEMAVLESRADGGIIITASHNPIQWNALKFLGSDGTFLNADRGNEVLRLSEDHTVPFATVENLGQIISTDSYLEKHIDAILSLPEVDVEAIRQAELTVAYDPINSVGAIALPPLFAALGIKQWHGINDTPNGKFAHNPEPLPGHLVDLCELVRRTHADVGFSVDPDVDRLAIIDETGTPFGEEYTLVAVADYLLGFHKGGNTVSNMSSTRALRDVTSWYGGVYTPAAVGEVNVVKSMRDTDALIGGEGNGGVIYPRLHAGRDALVGIALFLTHLAHSHETVSELRKRYPDYVMCKRRIELSAETDVPTLFARLKDKLSALTPITEDGIKIDFVDSWVQIRTSNTEPIVRVYTEAPTEEGAETLAEQYVSLVKQLLSRK